MITLARLEQEVARRTGPYFQAAQDSSVPTTSTTAAAYMPTLKTSALLGGPENLWLLRRGYYADGNPVAPPFNDVRDRIRMVQTFDPSAGRIVVDRNWRFPMQPNENAEFLHLHPDQELRPAVLAGLRRCFSEDVIQALVTDALGNIDLTAQAAWITNPSQVLRVQYGWYRPYTDGPFEATTRQGHVMLNNTSGPYAPANLWVTALRPAGSWINGADAEGPTHDEDELNVDLDYAAAAGHIEAWHLWPSHMFAAASGNLQATQEMAAREFTRQSLIWGPAPSRRIGFSEVVRGPLLGMGLR